MRSPSGSMADRIGFVGPTSCSVYVAIALASDRQRSSVTSGASKQRHSGPTSTKTWPGRLTTTSVAPSVARKGASGRMSSRRTESRARRLTGSQRIDVAEVEIPCDEDRRPVALVLVDSRLDVDRAIEDLLGK